MAENALAANPDFDLALEHLAVISEAQGDFERQRDYLSRALSLTPGSPVNHLNLGMTLCELGQMDEGGNNIREAIRLFPQYAQDTVLHELAEKGQLPPDVVAMLQPAG